MNRTPKQRGGIDGGGGAHKKAPSSASSLFSGKRFRGVRCSSLFFIVVSVVTVVVVMVVAFASLGLGNGGLLANPNDDGEGVAHNSKNRQDVRGAENNGANRRRDLGEEKDKQNEKSAVDNHISEGEDNINTDTNSNSNVNGHENGSEADGTHNRLIFDPRYPHMQLAMCQHFPFPSVPPVLLFAGGGGGGRAHNQKEEEEHRDDHGGNVLMKEQISSSSGGNDGGGAGSHSVATRKSPTIAFLQPDVDLQSRRHSRKRGETGSNADDDGAFHFPSLDTYCGHIVSTSPPDDFPALSAAEYYSRAALPPKYFVQRSLRKANKGEGEGKGEGKGGLRSKREAPSPPKSKASSSLPHIRVLMGIPTVDNLVGLQRRNLQRSSWLQYAQNYDASRYQRWKQKLNGGGGGGEGNGDDSSLHDSSSSSLSASSSTMMLVRYIIGRHHSNGYSYSSAILDELGQHRDMLLLEMKEGRPTTGKVSGGAGHWGLEAEVGMSRKALYWYVLAPRIYPSFDFIAKGDDDIFLRVPQYLCDLETKIMPVAAGLSINDDGDNADTLDIDADGGKMKKKFINKKREENGNGEKQKRGESGGGVCRSSSGTSSFVQSSLLLGRLTWESHVGVYNTSSQSPLTLSLSSSSPNRFSPAREDRVSCNANRGESESMFSWESVRQSENDDACGGKDTTGMKRNSPPPHLSPPPPLPPAFRLSYHQHGGGGGENADGSSQQQNQNEAQQQSLLPLEPVRGIYWGKVMKWQAVKNDKKSEFLFVGGMCITMSRDVMALVAADETLYTMSGPFVSFRGGEGWGLTKKSSGGGAGGLPPTPPPLESQRGVGGLFKGHSPSSTDSSSSSSSSLSFSLKEWSIVKNSIDAAKEIVADPTRLISTTTRDEDKQPMPMPTLIFVSNGSKRSSNPKDHHGTLDFHDGVGGIGDFLSVALRYSFINSSAETLVRAINSERTSSSISSLLSSPEGQLYHGLGIAGLALSDGNGMNFEEVANRNSEVNAKPIYKFRNVEHEDVMVGRSLYHAARKQMLKAGGSSGGGESGRDAPSPSFSFARDVLLRRAELKLNFMTSADSAATSAEVAGLSPPSYHRRRPLSPHGHTYSLRQSLGILMVEDCRYHDVHTGANVASITDRSVVIHHLKSHEYENLFERFGGGGEEGKQHRQCQRCMDTQISDYFKRGHPVLKLC